MRKFGALLGIATLVVACTRGPSDAELDRALAEAQSENEALRIKSGKAEAASWTLTVRGNVKNGGVELSWDEIERRAKSHTKTTSPTNTKDITKELDFRGIIINDLLTELGARDGGEPGGHDLTIIAADGFRATRPLDVYRRFPVMLAVEEEGLPLVRKTGGPLLEVFPHSTHPQSQKEFGEGGAYYVTTLIVGTEKLALDVAGKKLDARDLEGMSQKSVTGKVGFRSRWTSSGISIHGPLLRDVIEVGAKVTLEKDATVKIGRKPHSDVATRQSMLLDAADVLACDIIVGTRFGDDHTLIPAAQGGPVVLAFPKSCAQSTKNQPWPLYVESISIISGSDAGADDAGKPGNDGG